MSWAETKTINSNPLVPLDKLILGEKIFVSSDTTLKEIGVGEKWFVPKLDGSLRIKFVAKLEESSATLHFTVIYGDGREKEFSEDIIDGTVGKTVILFFDINVTKGIKFKVEHIDALFEFEDETFYVCGQVLDANYYDIEVV